MPSALSGNTTACPQFAGPARLSSGLHVATARLRAGRHRPDLHFHAIPSRGRPDHPIADLSRERIKRRPVLGGVLNEYERAAQKPRSRPVAEF